jgi:hypothetical protein
VAQFPKIKLPDDRMIEKPHPEWVEHRIRWRWLIDSWEGGEIYRNASYGYDRYQLPVRNMIRHKREYPETGSAQNNWQNFAAGADNYAIATDDDYELRRARTPVPTFVSEAIEAHLARIYQQEVDRERAPGTLKEWFVNVDGCGATIDEWIAEIVAPMLMVLGCLDVIVDHPVAPKDVQITSKADQAKYGLNRAVASIILPENMVWWTLNPDGSYAECLICEPCEDDDDCEHYYRYWNAKEWIRFDDHGRETARADHQFKRVPICRLFDRRRPRCRNIGLPRYEAIAELQREYYNRDSELILSDTTQAHPLLQGPEDYIQADGTIPIGPSWMLPKKKTVSGAQSYYEAFEVVEFPKGGADSIRSNKYDLRDAADRAAGLTKPAGAAGTTGSTVAQSGISKRLDQSQGNDLLGRIAAVLEKAEKEIARLVLVVLSDGKDDGTSLLDDAIGYPRSFDLQTSDELAAAIVEFQTIVSMAGHLPECEGDLLGRLVRLMLPGLEDEEYGEMDDEIEAYLATKSVEQQQMREASVTTAVSTAESIDVGNQSDPTE